MKIWVDDIRPAPKNYTWCRTVNETILLIEMSEKRIDELMEKGNKHFLNREYEQRTVCYNRANDWNIDVIDLDHDAGDFANQGGDYIKILDWLEKTDRSYPIRIHSMNPVGRENMRAIIRKNGWKEID